VEVLATVGERPRPVRDEREQLHDHDHDNLADDPIGADPVHEHVQQAEVAERGRDLDERVAARGGGMAEVTGAERPTTVEHVAVDRAERVADRRRSDVPDADVHADRVSGKEHECVADADDAVADELADDRVAEPARKRADGPSRRCRTHGRRFVDVHPRKG
jgi:hypothetical protein